MTDPIRVLVVDDSDFFGTLVSGELKSLYDMDVEVENSALEGLERLEETTFDCIVSDYDMPDINGIEFFEKTRNMGIEVPFFLLTAAGSEEVASAAITAGVTDYFPKSSNEDQFEILGKRIKNIVAQRRAERDLQRQRRLHEVLWDVTQDLLHAPTRAEIEANVCERLTATDYFSFAWVSDSTSDETTRAIAGIGTDRLADVQRALDGDRDDDIGTVAAMRKTRTATVETPSGSGTADVVVVPLLYQGSTYGVLGLGTTSRDTLGDSETEALERLGTTVGHALAAVEMQREVEIFKDAVEQADPAIVITDTAGTIEYVNTAFEEITGHSGAAATGESFDTLVVEEWNGEDFEAVSERVRNGDPVRKEVLQRRKDGTPFHADLSVAPITVAGEVRKFVAIESDITGLKTREQRLQVLNRILRHNLRNDLNVVKGCLALLVEGLDDQEALSRAENATSKVDDLLSLGEKARYVDKIVRSTSDGESTTPIALGPLVRRQAKQVREEFPGATVAVDIDDDIAVETEYLGDAIHELLVNAVEHNDKPDPEVTVTTTDDETPDGFVAIEIADNGPGIPDQEREVIEQEQETELQHSSALGLWLVNWIVTQAGGELYIEEATDDGSVVRLTVPTHEHN